MAFWEIVVPEGTTNLEPNPSFETNTTGWATAGTNTIAQSGAQSKYGAYSLLCTYQDNGNIAYENITLTAAAHTLTAWLYIPSGFDGTDIELHASAFVGATGTTSADFDMSLTDQWQSLSITFTPDAGDLTGNLLIWIPGGTTPTAGKFVYLDGVQCEALGYATTYCDGTQKGCEWNGTAHASTSTRAALSRAGGRVYDLDDDYNYLVTGYIDSGVAPLTQHLDEYATKDGGEVSDYKVHPRVLTLQGFMYSRTSFADLHDNIQSLIGVLAPNAVPGNQPVLLRYTEASITKEIAVFYEAGLAGNFRGNMCAQQNFAIRFLADDPFWYQIGESGAVLDTEDTPTLRYFSGRLRSTGQWDDVGISNNPAGGGNIVYAILYASDGMVYIGGDFTGWDNVANRDYVAQYNPQTDTWATWGAASDFNGIVFTLCEGPDGSIYAGGQFTNCHAVAAADYIAVWNGTAWGAVGVPLGAASAITTVYDMAFDRDGDLYIVGEFTDWASAGASNLDYIVSWDGTNYSAVGAPATGATITRVRSVCVDSRNYVYVGGNFTNFAGDADADYFAYWDTSAWTAPSDSPNGIVWRVAVNATDEVYLGGTFTTIGGDTNMVRIGKWTGQAFESLGTGLTGSWVFDIAVTGLNSIIAVGNFGSAGDRAQTNHIAIWNGSDWAIMDIYPSASSSYAIELGPRDPVVDDNFDIYIGLGASAAQSIAGLVTITNDGTMDACPEIHITRSGGTYAQLRQIRNENTGKVLHFDYVLQDGEEIVIDPRSASVTSVFYGVRADAGITGSEWAEFTLIPEDNDISAHVYTTGAPTVTAWVVYRDTYWSLD